MSWAKVDDKFFAHPKVTCVSFGARGLWVTALSWCASMETDGLIPEDALRLFACVEQQQSVAALVDELLKAQLWALRTDGVRGYIVHDYLEHNPSRKQLKHKRKTEVARLRAYRKRTCVRSEVRTLLPSRPVPSRPVPVQVSFASLTQGSDEPGFSQFWIAYPKKRHKPQAQRAWRRVATDTAAILVGLEGWKQSDQWLGGRIEDPGTFLNQRQWEDPVPVPAADAESVRRDRERARIKARLFGEGA